MTFKTFSKVALIAPALCLALGGCASANRFVMRILGHKQVEQAQVRASFHETAQVATGTPADRMYKAATTYIEARDYGRALDMLQLAKEAAPNDVRVLNALGVVYDKLGRFDLSARYYVLAQAADPGSPIVAANIQYSMVLQEMQREIPRLQDTTPTLAKIEPPAVTRAPIAAVPPTLRLAGAYSPDSSPLRALPSAAGPAAPLLRLAVASGGVRRAEPILTGAPLALINASGSPLAPEPTRRYLAQAGWTLAASARTAPVLAQSEIRYPAQNVAIATALAKTLPFKVALTACASDCPFQLVLGRDAPTALKAPAGRS